MEIIFYQVEMSLFLKDERLWGLQIYYIKLIYSGQGLTKSAFYLYYNIYNIYNILDIL